jgi:hypothetical protein
VAGNWTGAALVAGAALLLAGVLGGVLALLVKPVDFGVGHTLDLAAVIAAGAFGADLTFGAEDSGDFFAFTDGSIGIFPLTITVAVVLVLVVLFRRMVRDYPGPLPALGDAVRVALLVGLGLMVVAIVFRGDNERLGRGVGRELSEDVVGLRVEYGVSVVGALFQGFALTLLVLALVVAARSAWWPPRARRVADRVGPALHAYLLMLAALPVVGLIGFLLLGFGEESLADLEDEEAGAGLRQLLAVVFALLGNGGVWLLGLGAGAPVGGSGSYSSSLEGTASEGEWVYLWQDVTQEEPGLWASPVILLAVLAGAATVVVRRSRERGDAFGNLLVWVGGLVVVVPLAVRLANLHGSAGGSEPGYDEDYADYESFGGPSDFEVSGTAGLEGLQATFYVVVIALLVALAVARLTGTLDLSGLRRTLGSLQVRPVAATPTGQPPTGQPPSGPPPAGPPSGPPPAGPPSGPPSG